MEVLYVLQYTISNQPFTRRNAGTPNITTPIPVETGWGFLCGGGTHQKKPCKPSYDITESCIFAQPLLTETFIHIFTTLISKKWNQMKEKKEKKIMEMKEKTRKQCI